MNYEQLISLIARVGTVQDKEELFRTQDRLIRYWRKECEIQDATVAQKIAGLDLIDTACANVLARFNNEKVLQP